MAPTLAAVVLNYRTPLDTLQAVQSLLASERPIDDIVVVDNDRGEACWDALAPVAGRLTRLSTGCNLGFSGGINAGLRTALELGAESLLVVNSDVVVSPDCVGLLDRALRARADAGIAGPIVVSRSDPTRVLTGGIRYDTTTGRMRHYAAGARLDSLQSDDVEVVDGVSGCLMLIKRRVLEEAGLFDERFFYSFEDLDLCLRAQRAGLSTVVVRRATALHEGGRSIGATSTRRLYYASRNHLLLVEKASGRTRGLAPACRMSAVLLFNFLHAVTSTGASLPDRLGAVFQGARDYSNGRFGIDR
jgi:GT2 family glycosyltransferase